MRVRIRCAPCPVSRHVAAGGVGGARAPWVKCNPRHTHMRLTRTHDRRRLFLLRARPPRPRVGARGGSRPTRGHRPTRASGGSLPPSLPPSLRRSRPPLSPPSLPPSLPPLPPSLPPLPPLLARSLGMCSWCRSRGRHGGVDGARPSTRGSMPMRTSSIRGFPGHPPTTLVPSAWVLLSSSSLTPLQCRWSPGVENRRHDLHQPPESTPP